LIPTPILIRTKDANGLKEGFCHQLSVVAGKAKMNRRPQARYATKDGEAHYRLSENMRQIKRTIHPIRYSLYEGIYNALDALLKKTKSAPPEQDIPRSRTLLSLCLRRVPFYIKEEAAWISRQAKESGMDASIEVRDVSEETYSNLESFGSSMGWKHLRTVVRAHGITVVSDAIAGGLIDSKFASALVMLCVHASFCDEGEILLEALLTSLRYPDPVSTQSRLCDNSAMLPLSTLNSFVKYTGRVGYYQRKLATLFSTGLLPVTWLATKDFALVWNSIFRSLSTDPPDHNASMFISTILPIIYAARQVSTIQVDMLSVLDATFTSLVITLSAMIILGRNIIHLLRNAIIDCGLFSSIPGGKQAEVIATANILAGLESDSSSLKWNRDLFKQLLDVLRKNYGRPPSTIECVDDSVITFICSVARCCGRGSSGDGFEYLQTMLERLESPAIDLFDGEDVLSRIIVDSAFAFAQQVPNREHLRYAERIGTKYRGVYFQKKASQKTVRDQLHMGFRWEEGISEWVTATPAATTKKRDDIRMSISSDESDDQTLRPSLKRHKSSVALRLKAKEPEYAQLTYNRVSNLVPPTPHIYHGSELLLDEPLVSDSSQVASHFRIPSNGPRRPVSKIRRVGWGLLPTKKDWDVFDESDDELSSSILTTSETGSILAELPDCLNSGRRKRFNTTKTMRNRAWGEDGATLAHSEDELCL
jgi:hypothetical protein